LAPSIAPDSVRQGSEVTTRLLIDFAQGKNELMVRLESTSLISGQRSRAHLQAYSGFGILVEGAGLPRCSSCLGQSASAVEQKTFAKPDQGRSCLGAESGAFHGRPVLELWCVLDGKSLEEIAMQEPDGIGRLGRSESSEPEGIDVQTLTAQDKAVTLGLEPSLTQAAAQAVHRFVQRVTGSGFILVGPEGAKNLISGSAVLGSEGEIDEEGQVLPPENLGRRIPATEPGSGRPEADEREASQIRSGLHTIPNM